MAKHTKGPWHRNIKPTGKYSVIFAGRNTHVATVANVVLSDDEIEANCNLIAAAPELLEMTKLLEQALEYEIRKDKDEEGRRMKNLTLVFVKAAIAKAEGRPVHVPA